MPRLIAHRGFADEHPENTLSAVRESATVADGIEVDVRRCASGEPVVIHDETVDPVTGASGRVADLSREDLASLSVLGTDEGVPTLPEVLEACPPDITLHVELKDPHVANEVLSLVGEAPHEVVVSSFSTAAIRACRDAEVPLALLHADPGGIETARNLDCRYVHPHHELVDREYVQRARDAGLAVNAWTIRTSRDATRLLDLGIDGVIADRADVLDATDRP